MNKEIIGLNTELYTFKLSERNKFLEQKDRLSLTGKVEEVMLNNQYGLEYRKYRIIGG